MNSRKFLVSDSRKEQEIDELSYKVRRSGIYKFRKNLTFKPRTNGSSAIEIESGVENVILDLRGHTLSMDSCNNTADNFGILINANCRNILIRNGTIQGFSASQIRGYTNLNQIKVQNVILNGITDSAGGQRLFNETTSSGVNFGPVLEIQDFQPDPFSINNEIVLENVQVNDSYLADMNLPDLSLWGICLYNCNNVVLNDVNVNRITNDGLMQQANVETVGFGLYQCTNVISRNCITNDVTSFTPNYQGLVTGDAVGFIYLNCNRTENYNCTFNNCVGTRRGGGLTWLGSSNFLAENCSADNNYVLDSAAPGVQSHYGFEVIGDFGPFSIPQNGVIKNCEVLNMPTAFISNSGENIVFENCTAIAGNLVDSPNIETAGFECAFSDGVAFLNCTAIGFETSGPTINGGFLVGISINVTIKECFASKNSIGISVVFGVSNLEADSNELTQNSIFGIYDDTPVQTPNLYIRNVAYANGTNYSVNTSNPNFAVVQTNQGSGFPLYNDPNASPLSNYDLQV